MVVKAPRKDRRKKPLFSSFADSSFEYTFPGVVGDETRDGSTEPRDLHFSPRPGAVEEETRDQLEPRERKVIPYSDRRETRFSRDEKSDRNNDAFDCNSRLPVGNGHVHDWMASTALMPTYAGSTRSDLYSPPRLPRHTSIYDGIFCSPHGTVDGNGNHYPIQAQHGQPKVIHRRMVPRVAFQYHEIIGPRSLNIHRLRLPSEYLHLLDKSKFTESI